MLEGLGILARTDIGAHRDDAQGWYLFSQASRLMYADRDRYYGDPDFVDVPMEGLLEPTYLDTRAKLINPTTAGPPPAPVSCPRQGQDPRAGPPLLEARRQ